jgi:hypothetical protein
MIKQQWQQAVEEFGDRVFERFTVRCAPHINKQVPMLSNQDFEDYDKQDMVLKPLGELFEHDVSVYGDDAYLMWECADIEDYNWIGVVKNSNMCLLLHDDCCMDVRRKTSAALPFDLSRAKANDVVEMLCLNGKWENVIDNNNAIKMYEIGLSNKLRMKYPPKLLTNY